MDEERQKSGLSLPLSRNAFVEIFWNQGKREARKGTPGRRSTSHLTWSPGKHLQAHALPRRLAQGMNSHAISKTIFLKKRKKKIFFSMVYRFPISKTVICLHHGIERDRSRASYSQIICHCVKLIQKDTRKIIEPISSVGAKNFESTEA